MWDKLLQGNLACPHCQKEAMSPLRKQFLGPFATAICPHCGGKLGIPGSAVWTLLPFASIAIFALQYPDSFARWSILFGGYVVMAFLYHRYVAFIPK
jgi:hypothetical protein